MNKAARIVRRSSARLLSLSAGHTDLNVVISELKSVKSAAKAFLAAQQSASEYLMRWAINEENKSLKDACCQMMELSALWSDVQKEFLVRLKVYRKMFDLILEGEKHVDVARNALQTYEHKEAKYRKDLKKAYKKGSADDLMEINAKLSDVIQQKRLAQIDVDTRTRENEAVKSIRFKEGLRKYSEAYIELGQKCTVVFEAHEELAYALPDAYERGEQATKYNGCESGRQSVTRAKDRIRLYHRQPYSRANQESRRRRYFPEPEEGEPPPPYTAPESIASTSAEDSASFVNYHAQQSYESPSRILRHSLSEGNSSTQQYSLDYEPDSENPHEQNIFVTRSMSDPAEEGGVVGQCRENRGNGVWVARVPPDGGTSNQGSYDGLAGAVGGLDLSSTV